MTKVDLEMVGIMEEEKVPFPKEPKRVDSLPTGLKPIQQLHSKVSRAEAGWRNELNTNSLNRIPLKQEKSMAELEI